jgi:hypothetical protein
VKGIPMIFCTDFHQKSFKAPSKSKVTVWLLSPAATIFKRLSGKAGARRIFYPKCMIFILDIQQTFGNNSGKFQCKRLIGSREMNFYLHAPIKKALKTGTSQKST